MKVSNGFKVYNFDRLYTACKMLGEYIKNNSEVKENGTIN